MKKYFDGLDRTYADTLVEKEIRARGPHGVYEIIRDPLGTVGLDSEMLKEVLCSLGYACVTESNTFALKPDKTDESAKCTASRNAAASTAIITT